ncbi:putative glycoside hydrolase family 15 protein [Arthrobacter sp. Sa2BUA2]|uniref:Glycoside hydrolase family 15 protein n=1 Tax=Arthrobacter pullicola TaxID=2762224 RepID=A0ABR8YGL2_9MICC|nr:putative glycoside hydrolase [Arthrobacter pullicola]MBD8043355.1 putative glycoside hydrolase family 15 protein [Arthrobacter pullicola]
MSGVGAWIRYGDPVSPEQVRFAAKHYRAAILQPWETGAARELKRLRPDMTVLAYKCLSSVRSYEPGPVYSSGVSFAEAEAAAVALDDDDDGGGWFATRPDGARIEWERYPGHWQMKVWEPGYQRRWVENVLAEFHGSPFDGVLADNDVFDDYYGLNLPIPGAASMGVLRTALGDLVNAAGTALNSVGKILVPNIAESRRETGRWAAHSAYGGGFEEVWLGYGPEHLFDPATAEAQLPQAAGPGLSILRVPTDGNDQHPNFLYGLSAFWIFGEGRGAYSATAHDDYSRTQHAPELDWQLGAPRSGPQGRGHTWWREFDGGFAAVNFNRDGRRRRKVRIPAGMVDDAGRPAPSSCILPPQRGVLFRRSG